MHIPDGYLGPQTYVTMYVAMLPLWRRALNKLKQLPLKKNFSLLAVAAAFVFVAQMFNVPIPGGTTGHAVGGAVVALMFGPWLALLVVSLVLLIQAFVFGDGGLTAFGANSFAMAFVQPFTAVLVYRLVTGSSLFSNNATTLSKRQKLGAFLAGYLSVSLAATVVGVLFGLQPLVAQFKGKPLYAPYPLGVAVPAMALSHLLFFGPLEGVVTVLVLAYLAREAKTNLWLKQPESQANNFTFNWRQALLWLLVLALFTPLGLLAQGTAFGEWSSEELKKSLGFVPQGLAKLESFWSAPFSEYSFSAVNETLGYIFSALVGIGILYAIFKLITYFFPGQKGEK